MTVAQNFELHAQLYHLPPEKVVGRIEDLLERYDLKSVVNSRPDSLPLGMKHLIQLAVAWVHASSILILDEPTSGRRPDRARLLLAHADRPLARRGRDDFRHDPFHE